MARRYTRKKRGGKSKSGKCPKKCIKKVVTGMLKARGINKSELKNNIVYQAPFLLTLTNTSPGVRLDPKRQGNNDIIFNGYVWPTNYNEAPTPGGNVIGSAIVAKYLDLKMLFYNGGAGTYIVRVMVVCDYQPQSSTLIPFSTANLGNNANMFMSSDINAKFYPQSKRFDVLYNNIFKLSGESDVNEIKLINRRIPLHNSRVVYTNDTTDTDKLLSDNKQYILFVYANNSENVSYQYTADFAFTDV